MVGALTSVSFGLPGLLLLLPLLQVLKCLLQRLQDVLNRQQIEFNRAMIGRVLPVLLEKPGKHAGQLVGRSPYLQAVHCQAEQDEIGRVVDLRIDGMGHFSLSGTRATSVQHSEAAFQQEAVA